jgi:hypothetical protein
MLLRPVHLTTRLRSRPSSHYLFSASQVHVKVCTSSISSLTRPCAKPRATRFESATTWTRQLQHRGAKHKASVTLDDVPQGAIGIGALPQDDAEPDYPPLLQQVRNTMLKFSHCVLVTRVGGFYEVLL